ncbi:MAG: hypothetical protein ACTSQE_12835 [Candidatus Heimdallarchaeaceae archaeon]
MNKNNNYQHSSPTKNDLEKIITNAWKNIPESFYERKILYYEQTLVSCFYYEIRRELEQDFPLMRVIAEHQFKLKKPIDLALVEFANMEELSNYRLFSKNPVKLRVAMEFKCNSGYSPIGEKQIFADIKKLRCLTEKHPEIELCYVFYTGEKRIEWIEEKIKSKFDQSFKQRFRLGIGIFDDPYYPKQMNFTIINFI